MKAPPKKRTREEIEAKLRSYDDPGLRAQVDREYRDEYNRLRALRERKPSE